MANEDPFEELHDECYICFEQCNKKSPCKCNTYVHTKCLEKYKEASGNYEYCNICLEQYEKKDYKPKIIKYAVLIVILYISTGIVGQIIYKLFAQDVIVIYPPWSLEHFLSSIIGIAVIAFLYSLTNRNRIIL